MQPLDISVNKIFKVNAKNLFEQNRIFFYNLENNKKLKTSRINCLGTIKNNIIINIFKKAGFINIYYASKEEDRIKEIYTNDLLYLNEDPLIDNLHTEVNVNMNDLNNNEFDNDLLDKDIYIYENEINENKNDNIKEENKLNIKKEINSLELKFLLNTY